MAERKAEEKRALEREHKKAESQLQREGKRPFYLKKCEIPTLNGTHDQCCGCKYCYPLPPLSLSSPAVQKRLAMAEKYKQLKRTGKLEKFLSKKRKKNARRDRRQLPFKRKQ